MIHMMAFVELAADVNAQRRIKQETAGKSTKGPSDSGSLFARYKRPVTNTSLFSSGL